MRLSSPLFVLLVIGLFGSLMAVIIFDPHTQDVYNPDFTEYNNNTNYQNLLRYMNDSYSESLTNYENISEKTTSEEESSILTVGKKIISAIKQVGNLVNLGLISNLVETTASILKVPIIVGKVVLLAIFIAIIFAIIGAILRYKT